MAGLRNCASLDIRLRAPCCLPFPSMFAVKALVDQFASLGGPDRFDRAPTFSGAHLGRLLHLRQLRKLQRAGRSPGVIPFWLARLTPEAERGVRPGALPLGLAATPGGAGRSRTSIPSPPTCTRPAPVTRQGTRRTQPLATTTDFVSV